MDYLQCTYHIVLKTTEVCLEIKYLFYSILTKLTTKMNIFKFSKNRFEK